MENGKRIPVTYVNVSGVKVIGSKIPEKDSYSSVIVSLGKKKRELRLVDESPIPNVGDFVKASEVFKPGDSVSVTGVSKGKGFAGVVKRHGFHGGPKTHGQSDRHRAPGSIGQGTTPGRVYKGKKMAGRMGNARATIQNLEVVDVNDETLLLKGVVPGSKKSLILIRKTGENKKFVPLYTDEPIKEPEVTEEMPEVSVSDSVKSEEPAIVESSSEEKKEAVSVTSDATSDEPKEDKENAS